MSASNVGPGGVRNLRAMFENKATSDQSNSPPSRGRSPNGSVSSTQDRPQSKVRASFVAVEKAGEEAHREPASRQTSNITMDGANDHTVVDDQSLGKILKGSPFVDDGEFPSTPTQTSESNGVGDRAGTMVMKMQQGNIKPPPSGSYVDPGVGPKVTKPGPPRPKPKTPAENNSVPTDANKSPTIHKGPMVKPKGGVSKIQGIMASAARAQEGRVAAANEAKAREGASKSQDEPEPTTKSPTVPKGPVAKPKGGVSKIKGVIESAKTAKEERAAADSETTANSMASRETTKSPTTARLPRSSLPARRAPAAATAPTASSVAKAEDAKATESKSTERKVAKAPLKVANATTASSLAKKSSRASLNTSDGSKPKSATQPADEGFLARMMRPTASSAQKAHEKAPVHSPPRSRQSSGKALATRPSRRSLNQADENKENEVDTPPVPAVPQHVGEKAEPTRPQ